MSKASNDIGDFIIGLGVDVIYGKNEHKVGRYKIDVFVPNHNLAIELNGLRYHYGINKRDSYILKYKICLNAGMSFMMFYEDEWRDRRPVVESIIKHRLGINTPAVKLRPSAVEYSIINGKEANAFYDDYHYQGGCMAGLHIGVKYTNELIACMSIRKPSRQNAGDYEIARMASCNHYRVYGLWSHMMTRFIKPKLSTYRLITYSDNRIMPGVVYRKMGFSITGSVRPDYYWTDLWHRFHKSALRKTANERISGLTETQLRTADGLRKIYDLGKTKWSIEL